MSDDWREVVGDAQDHSYEAQVVWDRNIPDADDPEAEIKKEDPLWTPPPLDEWRPTSTLGSFSADPPAPSG